MALTHSLKIHKAFSEPISPRLSTPTPNRDANVLFQIFSLQAC